MALISSGCGIGVAVGIVVEVGRSVDVEAGEGVAVRGRSRTGCGDDADVCNGDVPLQAERTIVQTVTSASGKVRYFIFRF
jgi:hypothetical protein